jgi:hypothetical protein
MEEILIVALESGIMADNAYDCHIESTAKRYSLLDRSCIPSVILSAGEVYPLSRGV